MKHCYVIAKSYPLHMRVYVYRTREITSVVYAENEPVSHTKMADYRALVMGTL